MISVLCDAFTLAAGVFIDFTLLVLGFTPLALAAGARRIVFIWLITWAGGAAEVGAAAPVALARRKRLERARTRRF